VRSGAVFRIWVKRCRCHLCRSSDALLPSFCLVGRLDAVEVIGPALKAVACGSGTRPVAEGIGELFAHTTVRGWWRRHRERRFWLWALVGALVSCLPGLSGVSDTDALAALETVATALSGPVGVGLWPAVSVVSGGAWLSTTTDAPTTDGARRRLMAVMAPHHSRTPP
jgi:hypothetical protein